MTGSSAVVIPVYNEGERVVEVVEAALACPTISEVIAVNDGSNDFSGKILQDYDDLTALNHVFNLGKGDALDTGVTHALKEGHDQFVFLDGDLCGIKSDHIDQLLLPLKEDCLMTIGYLGLRQAVIKKTILNQWGALSGQRALTKEVWDLLIDRDKQGWNIEAALNARLRKNNLHQHIARVSLDGVGHIGKHDKTGSWPKAWWGYLKTYSAALRTYARIEFEK